MLTSRFAFRAVVLALSAIAHVLLYGALSLAPAWAPPPRPGLIVTELVASEPPAPPAPTRKPVAAPRPLVTRPRPLGIPTPPTPPIEIAAPGSAVPAKPSIEHVAATPPIEAAPPLVASTETPRDVTGAPASTITSSPSGPAISTITSSPGAVPSAIPSGSAPVVAALTPASPAAAPGTLTRMAIPRGGYQVTPSYPATARRLGIEGTALLRVFVEASGRVGDVVVKQSAGHPDLDRAAADAVRRWLFDPARRGPDAVAMWVELPVQFNLR